MASKAVTGTIGTEGLCPTLVVIVSLPCPTRRSPSETKLRRVKAVEAAKKEIQEEQAKRLLAFVLKHSGGRKGKEHSKRLFTLPARSLVYVYRDRSNFWGSVSGLAFIEVEGETSVV